MSMRKRPLANLNASLLDRLVRTGLLNICFTERQKLSLLHVSGTTSPTTANLFHQSMLELNLTAVGQTSEPPTVSSLYFVLNSSQTTDLDSNSFRTPYLSTTVRRDGYDERPRKCRVGNYFDGIGKFEGPVDDKRERIGGRRWERDEYLASPLQSRSRFVPGNLRMNELTIVMDGTFVVERSGSLLDRLRGEKVC
jgi:hypothetical protein